MTGFGKGNVMKRYLQPTHWVYVLAHFVLIVIGFLLAYACKDVITRAIGASLTAAGIAGWVLFVYILVAREQAERLEIITQFGLMNAFEARSVRIKSEYDTRLAVAGERIDLIGFGLRALRQDFADAFPSWAARARVRILLIDPEYPESKAKLADLRDGEEGEKTGTIKQDVHDFIRSASPVIKESGDKFMVRLYRCLPSVNIFRIDDDLFWGPYFVAQPSRNTPTFLVRRGGVLYNSLMQHFETIWSDERFSRAVPQDWLTTK
jgi:hypothetical protein